MTFTSRTAICLSDGRELIYFNEEPTDWAKYEDTRHLPPPPDRKSTV